jgi:carbon-monoxide dehydrogenase large subunit
MEYDRDTAQALSTTFVDYAIPRAVDLPDLRISLLGTPCASNPLGAKAVGEAGTVAAPPAIINAIVDALSEFGVDHLDMPATPARVWASINAPKAPVPALQWYSQGSSERPH